MRWISIKLSEKDEARASVRCEQISVTSRRIETLATCTTDDYNRVENKRVWSEKFMFSDANAFLLSDDSLCTAVPSSKHWSRLNLLNTKLQSFCMLFPHCWSCICVIFLVLFFGLRCVFFHSLCVPFPMMLKHIEQHRTMIEKWETLQSISPYVVLFWESFLNKCMHYFELFHILENLSLF